MSIRNLDKIFDPHRVAVIGASDTPTSVGYTVLRNLVGSGFRGVVYPVNPKRESVQGIQAYKDIPSLPHAPDLAVICTPAPSVPALVRQCGEAGTRGMVIISAGFREIGAEGRKLEELVLQEQRKFDGMRILGPNCLGIIVPGISLNASFAAATPAKGHIGFISQSGALCTSVLDWALDEGIGFSYFVSVGNMLDVSMGDLIDYFGSATETRSIILYIESISEAREFMSAARAFARTKPIVAYKAGRFAESAQAAASHTGAMAGVDAVYEAAFQRAGIERIFQIEDMFDCAELLARQQPPKGDRLAIITNAGGPGVMTTDALIARDGKLAKIIRRDDRNTQRVPADLLVAQQSGRRAGRCPARSLRQGRGNRAERQERRRRAGDSHAAGDDRSDGHGRSRRQGGRARPQAGAGGLDGRPRGGRGHPNAQRGRHSHLQHAGKGGPGVHAPGVLRPESANPARNAARHPAGVHPRSASGCAACSTRS